MNHSIDLSQTHLVTVWNPSYTTDAMEAHLRVLLDWAKRYEEDHANEDEVFVYWGKVRSPNRQRPQAHLDDIRALAGTVASSDGETQLYLTDYRSLYVGDVDAIVEEPLSAAEQAHVPSYYFREKLSCDVWFKVTDIRRLVVDDLPSVIAELKKLRNVHYADRPVSLYGGMVDLPLLVTRPDGELFFEEDARDAVTDGRLWAEFDADSASGLAAMEREIRDNLLGDSVWNALEPTTRIFIATAEQVFRTHRNDKGFDFSPVLGSFAKALEVQCNAIIRRAFRGADADVRTVRVGEQLIELGTGRSLMLGQLVRVIGGDQRINKELMMRLEHGAWFVGEFMVMLDNFVSVRNEATHAKVVERDVAVRWRNRFMGVGGVGEFVGLGKVRVKQSIR